MASKSNRTSRTSPYTSNQQSKTSKSKSKSDYNYSPNKTSRNDSSYANQTGSGAKRPSIIKGGTQIIRIIDGCKPSPFCSQPCPPPCQQAGVPSCAQPCIAPCAQPFAPPCYPCPPPPCPVTCPIPPQYCIPMRPRFCGPCPPCFPPPPPPIIVMPPPSHPSPMTWPCPAPPRLCNRSVVCCPRFPPPEGSLSQNEKHPYYNNCNFYTNDPNNPIKPLYRGNAYPKSKSWCSEPPISSNPSPSPPADCHQQRSRFPSHPADDDLFFSGRKMHTRDTGMTDPGWGKRSPYRRDIETGRGRCNPRTPLSYGVMNRRRRPTTPVSNDSIDFTINQGGVTRSRVPRTIRIETVEPASCTSPQDLPLPPPRRCGHKHRCRKERINTSCKKCMEKYIDEQVCRRLEELCIPDPCCCEPVEVDPEYADTGVGTSMSAVVVVVNNATPPHPPSVPPAKTTVVVHPANPHPVSRVPSPPVVIKVSTILPPRPMPQESHHSMLVKISHQSLPQESRHSWTDESDPLHSWPQESVHVIVQESQHNHLSTPQESVHVIVRESQHNHLSTPQESVHVIVQESQHNHLSTPQESVHVIVRESQHSRLSTPQESVHVIVQESQHNRFSTPEDSHYTVLVDVASHSQQPDSHHCKVLPQQSKKCRPKADASTSCVNIDTGKTKINLGNCGVQNGHKRPQCVHHKKPVPQPCTPPQPKYIMRPSLLQVDRVIVKKESLENKRQRHIKVFRHHVPHSIFPNPNYIPDDATKHHPQPEPQTKNTINIYEGNCDPLQTETAHVTSQSARRHPKHSVSTTRHPHTANHHSHNNRHRSVGRRYHSRDDIRKHQKHVPLEPVPSATTTVEITIPSQHSFHDYDTPSTTVIVESMSSHSMVGSAHGLSDRGNHHVAPSTSNYLHVPGHVHYPEIKNTHHPATTSSVAGHSRIPYNDHHAADRDRENVYSVGGHHSTGGMHTHQSHSHASTMRGFEGFDDTPRTEIIVGPMHHYDGHHAADRAKGNVYSVGGHHSTGGMHVYQSHSSMSNMHGFDDTPSTQVIVGPTHQTINPLEGISSSVQILWQPQERENIGPETKRQGIKRRLSHH